MALIVVLTAAAGFAVAVPFATRPLPQVDGVIPAYETALILVDAITAVMLFGQSRWSRSPGLLILGAGYLYDAVLTAGHALACPGAFAATGLPGADAPTIAWLFLFRHGGFPLFLIAYAVAGARKTRGAGGNGKADGAVLGLTIVATIALGIALTVLAPRAALLLSRPMVGNTTPGALPGPLHVVAGSICAVGVLAVVALWRKRPQSVLDLWLVVVACAWVFDIGLSSVFAAARDDLGFYAGRAYGVLAASFVLGALLVETGGLHRRLAAATALLDDYAHQLEARVRQRTAELEAAIAARQQAAAQRHRLQRMEALGQLAGGLAHDFNNHLGIIIGNLDLLGESELHDERRELADAATSAALNAAELTQRLLAFARRQPLRPQQIDVNRLIGEITTLLRRTLDEPIAIGLDLDRSVPPVVVDPAQLETAIANLANNARDAMPRGGRLTITTGTRHLDEAYAAAHAEVTPGEYVMIEVGDTGTGMPPEVLARAFEPFFTTKAPGTGTGLGLSMVFGFLKQSGGHIDACSEPGRGSIFRLYLRPAETLAAAPDAPIPGAEPRGGGERILIVEDNARLRAVLARQLAKLGYAVTEAENATEALALIDRGAAIDLLLTDVVMPGPIDGRRLARAFIARRPGGKVLLTSGFPGTRPADIAAPDVGPRLLAKPYRKQDLARLVREVLDEPAPDACRSPLGGGSAAL